MALDYRKCAEEIFSHLGGRENIVQAAHCATRLRLVLADNSKIDKKALEEVDGVKGMFESNGQVQLIIGTGTVNKVYDEFLAVTGMTAATKDDVKAAAAAQAPAWRRALKSIGDVFVPILPAIVASGLMMGLVEALGKAIDGFSDTAWYGFLDMAANTAFAYLPVIVAISAARVFGANQFLGAVMGLMMIHSNLLNAWTVTPDTVVPIWKLFGNWQIGGYVVGSIRQVGYQGHVIPVIISVWLMSKIEKWLHKHVPEMIDLFVVPLCTVLSTALITFIVIGPIFAQLESWVLVGAEKLVQNIFGAMIMGALYPFTVVMGLHHMYNVIEAGMLSSDGLNTWMPIASAANFAQFGACLAVGLKAKKAKTKTVAIPSSLSAALGITEPAIFGVNFRFMKPFFCGVAGGACGAIFGAITKIGASSYGVTGIPGYLTIDNKLVYTILLLISGGVAFILSWLVWKEEVEEAPAEGSIAKSAAADTKAADDNKEEAAPAEAAEKVIYAPITGNVVSREEIPDETFASGVLGDGVGIDPSVGEVVAPYDGEISSVTETKHAIGITGPGEMELLIHVGVDTVNMKGEGFELHVAEGDKVKKGQKLITFDIEKIKEAGYSPVTAVLLTNSDDYNELKVEKTGDAKTGDKIISVD